MTIGQVSELPPIRIEPAVEKLLEVLGPNGFWKERI